MDKTLRQQLVAEMTDLQAQIDHVKQSLREDQGISEVEDRKQLETLLRRQKDVGTRLNSLEEND